MDDERELLVEQVVGAWRPTDPDGAPQSHPAWHDLDGPGRRRAHEDAVLQRTLEAALDPEGLSSTSRLVLARIRRDP